MAAAITCPICGLKMLVAMHGDYQFEPPSNIPGGLIVVENTSWLHCDSCGEDVLSIELETAINRERDRRLELLTPEETRAVRERIA